MAAKVVVEGSSVSASQMKDFFRQAEEGSITGSMFQVFLDHRNPFASLHVGRSFDPAKFIGEGWRLGKRDPRSRTVREIDVSKILLETRLEKNETFTDGDERIRRLDNAKRVRLNTDAFLAFWENQHMIPESWKANEKGETLYVFFDGDELLSPYGSRYSLYLYWNDGRWYWHYYWLDHDRGGRLPSAVLEN